MVLPISGIFFQNLSVSESVFVPALQFLVPRLNHLFAVGLESS